MTRLSRPIFSRLVLTSIKNKISDGYSDAYTKAFFPKCEALTQEAEAAKVSGDLAKASDLYLRIAALYRISRFPYMNTAAKWKAWELQKDAYAKGVEYWDDPMTEKIIPHSSASGADKLSIPVHTRRPSTAGPQHSVPTVLLITGLDGYRIDMTQRSNEIIKRGWACVIAEIPGTADCPADPKDPTSPDRLWTSVLDWMSRKGVFDMEKIVAWGLSTGGYYAVRIAHTHKERLRGVVAQGAGLHHFFSREWMDRADLHEYPFA